MIILINFVQLLSTSESFSDEDSPSDYEESPNDEESPTGHEESPNDEESPSDYESPTGHEDEDPGRDKSNYSKESSDCNEQIISEGK